MGLNFPSQSDLLFDDKWDAAKDICLVQILINDTKINLEERSANVPIASLRRARRVLNHKYDGIFSWDDVCARYANLKDRYRTFKALVEHPDVFWDELTNIVHANDYFWSNFCEQRSLARAYYYCGESIIDELKTLFGRSEDDNLTPYKREFDNDAGIPGEEGAMLSMENSRRRLFEAPRLRGFRLPPPNFPPRKPDADLLCAFTRNGKSITEEWSDRSSSDSSSSST